MFFEFKMHRICAKNKVKQRIEENYEGKFNRVKRGLSPLLPTPPDMRVRIRLFMNFIEP